MFIRNIIKRSFNLRLRLGALETSYCFSSSPNPESPKLDPSKNYYSILQVDKDASIQQINISYGQLFSKYQHDRNKGPDSRYAELVQAYQILVNPRTRKDYNQKRFFHKFDQKINEGLHGKESDLNSDKLTPEEQEYYARFNRKLKYFLMAVTALAMFGPFFFWKGGQVQPKDPDPIIDAYPKRHGGMYLNRFGLRDQLNQGSQGQHPPQPYQPMNPPGVIVTGQIVEN